MVIEIDLKKCSYEFLIVFLQNRESLSTDNKSEIIAELARRNHSESKVVQEPH